MCCAEPHVLIIMKTCDRTKELSSSYLLKLMLSASQLLTYSLDQ